MMDTLNLTLLQSFLAVAHTRSFQAAARQLALAQPTVSLHVQKLEEQLGVQLFQRSRIACSPTPAALNFLPHAESLLRMNRRALDAIRQPQTRIGACSNIGIYILQPLLGIFRRNQPAFQFDLLIDRNPVIAERLEHGELDIGLMEWWDGRAGCQAVLWRRDPLVVIMAPQHPWCERTFIDRAELQDAALLGGEPGSGTGRLLARYFGSEQATPKTALQLGSTEAVKRAVSAGLGISLVLQSAVRDEIADQRLVARPLQAPGLAKELWLIWRTEGHAVTHSPFVQFLLGYQNADT